MEDGMTRFVTEFAVPSEKGPDLSIEDGGRAMIVDAEQQGGDGCFFVRLHSWDETLRHPLMKQFAGKRVRVTVETID
jgi:hypothetical protein